MKTAVVVLPTYNEAGSVGQVIEGIFAATKNESNWEMHVSVVDSNSTDKTQEIVMNLTKKYPNLHLIKSKKEGLGRAYINGFQIVLEELNPFLIFEMDADLSHDPKMIPSFLREVEKGADFVIGARYIKGGSIPKEWALHRKLFSVLGNLVIRFGFMNLKVTDWTDGFRAIKAWIVKSSLDHVKNYSGYVFQIALLDHAIRQHAIVKEIPIHFKDREKGVSKINAVQYITQSLFYVFTHSSFIKFVIVGGFGFIIDFGVAYFLIHIQNIAKPTANAISAETAIISNFLFNNFWSFAHKKIGGGVGAFIKKLLTFNIVSSGSILIQWVGLSIALRLIGDTTIRLPFGVDIHSWIIYKIFIIVFLIIPYSYVVYNKVVWRSKK